MKILELKFKNLNSLYGEWSFDFSHSEFSANGIFAITGPTGAGKSTILDAICLALYGSTPRLGRITKAGNEVMSKQTGECYAEVTFESQAGKYRCHWSQHRARKRSEGNLAEARHEISDALSGQILESKKRDVADMIEQKTGMDFERFTRSALLAQGGFAAFLEADPDARAPILEQITGTKIYSDISMKVHERHREEREKLRVLSAEISGISTLGKEEEASLTLLLEEKRKVETALSASHQNAAKSLQWLTGIQTLKQEIAALVQDMATAQEEAATFKPDQERLAKALLATEYDGEFATLLSLRNQTAFDRKALEENLSKLPQTETLLKDKEEALAAAEKVLDKVKEELKTQAPLIRIISSIDHEINEKNKQIAAGEQEIKQLSGMIESCSSQLTSLNHKLETFNKEQEAAANYLATHAVDAALSTELAGIKEQIEHLRSLLRDQAERQKEAMLADKNLQTTADKCLKLEAELAGQKQKNASILQKVDEQKNELQKLLGDRLLRELRFEHEALLREMMYLQKIASLEDERQKLEDGKSCPLCGSLEHPFALGNIPEKNVTEQKIETLSLQIRQAEEMEATIRDLETEAKNCGEAFTRKEKEAAEVNSKHAYAKETLTRLQNETTALQERSARQSAELLTKLQTYGILAIPHEGLEALFKALQQRLHCWQDNQNMSLRIEKEAGKLQTEAETLKAAVQIHQGSLQDKLERQEILKGEREVLANKRHELFGAKSVEEEEKRLHKQIADAEIIEKAARLHRDGEKQLADTLKTRIASLQESLAKKDPELKCLDEHFLLSIGKAGFSNEEAFLAARLTVNERNLLSARAKTLEGKQTELSARKTDRENSLKNAELIPLTEASLEELKAEYRKLEEALTTLREEIGGIKQKLSDNLQAREKIKDKQSAIDAQKKECAKWDALHALIGSVDGKKYRNFAQGLTFELMVKHANRQLQKMSDRYLLKRDNNEPLELNVVDNFQAGEIRSTKNLSGGEKFIVSLSLALGLSKMSSRKVRVDSLFLDEGFGTLDEEALETALESLSGLQHDGKLIGIISHVPALKERIMTQINVYPVSGGKSRITGPGIYADRL
jgi:DNA repair protein SbcC/Rad50